MQLYFIWLLYGFFYKKKPHEPSEGSERAAAAAGKRQKQNVFVFQNMFSSNVLDKL